MKQRSANINVMFRAATKAARKLRRDFNELENLQVSRKGPADFVSSADLEAERTLREELEKARPGYGFLMEESGHRAAAAGKDGRWIVDPLDGTSNFLHGLPHWAISIALEERGELVAGIIYDSIKEDFFYAEKGQGAFLNDRRIRASGRKDPSQFLVATGMPFLGRGDRDSYLVEADAVMAATAGLRRWGAASLDLAYVAAGRFDGFWEWGLAPWDVAAGIVILREAGGLVTEVNGKGIKLDSPSILAGNQHSHFALMKMLRVNKAAAARG